MAITAISRTTSDDPNIVNIITTDNLSTITAPYYWLVEQPNVLAINNGEFIFLPTDFVLIAYNGGISFFTFNASMNTFVQAGFGGGSSLLTANVTLTSSDIQNMASSPVLLLPAPGASNFLVIDTILWEYVYVAPEYQNGGDIVAIYGNTPPPTGITAATTFIPPAQLLTYTENLIFTQSGYVPLTISAVGNQPIYLGNGGSAFTAGNSYAYLTIRYWVYTLMA